MRIREWIRKGRLLAGAGAILVGCLFFNVGGGMNVGAAEQDGAQNFRFSKPLDFKDASGLYRAVFLDEQVYAGASQDLNDLRIVNEKGQFVPYYIDNGYSESAEDRVKYTTELLGEVKKEKDNSVFDFVVTPLGKNVDIRGNSLKVSLPNENFLKHVEVYGSYDSIGWERVKMDDLYRIDSLTKDIIELDDKYSFRYYRLKVLNNVEGLSFPQMQLSNVISDLQWRDFQKSGTPKYEVKQEDGFTDIIIQNPNHLRIKRVQLTAAGNFTRTYELMDSEGKTIETENIPELFSMDFKDVRIADTTITAIFPTITPAFTIRINNQDDLPLDISDITIEYKLNKLVFEDKGTGPYRLLYGNDTVIKPQYDIVKFRSHIEQEDMVIGTLGEETTLPVVTDDNIPVREGFATKPWFSGVIIVISVVLIGLLAQKLRKTS